MRIIDAHVHFWDPQRLHYPWLPHVPQLNRAFLLQDYNAACGEIQVEAMYFVQAECAPDQAMEEVRFISELAVEDPRLRGMVPFAPLELGNAARPWLETLQQNPLVKGVRRMIKSEQDLDFCLRPKFLEGVHALADYNFSFALGINWRHMKNAAKLVEACPNVKFAIDHFAQPDIKHHMLDPWRDDLRRLAAQPNTWCKLSSLATEADHTHWTVDDVRPYLEHVAECFPANRIMFATDWPVSTQAMTIPQAVDIICKLDPALINSTALDFYENRLP